MANKIYVHQETSIYFRPSGLGGGGNNLDITSLADQAGRYSARVDLGASARSLVYEWRAKIKLNGAGILGQSAELYLITSDGSLYDGGLSNTAGAAVTAADKRRNLQYLGSLIVDDEGSNPILINSGPCNIFARYVSILVWNNTGVPFSSTDSDHGIYLYPSSSEIQ